MSAADKKKLDGIATGAEVNVQSDWNATSGDAFIKNKPTIPTVNNAKFSIKGAGTEVSSTTANASSASSVDIVAGANVTVTPDATNKKITISATDTTYSSKTAAAEGIDVSLVTTGEKYIWNSLRAPKLTIGDYTGTYENYTTFASVSSTSTSRYKDCIVLVSGGGYYHTGGNTGAWIIEMRSTNAGSPIMTVRRAIKPSTSSTVKFGYYTDTEEGKTYFGIHSTSRRSEFNVTVLMNNSNLFTIAAGEPVIITTDPPVSPPTGWQDVEEKEYLTEVYSSMSESKPIGGDGKTTYHLTIGDSTYDIADTDTRYNDFWPSGTNAASGLVPKPSTAPGTTKYLREDATWAVPPNTTYSAGTGLSLSGTTFSLALTKALVTTALGYTPPTSDTNTHRPI